MAIERIYLDMDGVLCDLLPGIAELYGRLFDPEDWPPGEYDVSVGFGIPRITLWNHIGKVGGASFWAGLTQTEHYEELVELSRLFALKPPRVLSSPTRFPSSYAGKAAWLIERDWQLPNAAFLGAEKWQLSKPGRVLIDDNSDNCIDWEAEGGSAILFPTISNELHKIATGGDALGYVRTELERISGRKFGRNDEPIAAA
jgi:hypothetical protein